MQQIEGATLDTLREVLETKENLYPEQIAKLDPIAQDFFNNQIYGPKPEKFAQDTKTQIAQRLYTLGRMKSFNAMFSATENKFDAFKCMQEKKIVLVNTDASDDGLGEASPIFGRFILASCLAAARRRPRNERHLALLVVDEFKAYADDHLSLIFSDARQFGLGLLVATQLPHQLDQKVEREINTNTAIKLFGKVEYKVASSFYKDMHTTPEFITGMESFPKSYAEWACYVAGITPHAIKLSVPFGAVEGLPKMDDLTYRAMRAANMAQYGVSPEVAVPFSMPPEPPPVPAGGPPDRPLPPSPAAAVPPRTPDHENVKKPPPEPARTAKKETKPKAGNDPLDLDYKH